MNIYVYRDIIQEKERQWKRERYRQIQIEGSVPNLYFEDLTDRERRDEEKETDREERTIYVCKVFVPNLYSEDLTEGDRKRGRERERERKRDRERKRYI